MYIVAAQLQAQLGKGPEAAAYMSEGRDLIAKIIGRPAYAWSVPMGAPIGTFMFSTRAESQAQWLSDIRRLGEDAAYTKFTAGAAGVFTGAAETRFSQIVTATASGDPKAFTVVTTASMATGRVAPAMRWSQEMLDLATSLIGSGGALTSSTTGNFNEVSWIFGFDTADELDTADGKIQADPNYMAKLDEAGGMFVDGTGQRAILVQMP